MLAMTYPVIARGSKIGFHQQMEGPALQFARDALAFGAPMALGKSVDHNGNLVRLRQESPTTITISRSTRPDIEACPGMDDHPSDSYLREMAYAMADFIASKFNAEERAAIDYFEMWNEPRPHTVAGYAALARLMMFSCEAAETYGFKAALFSLNAGTPEWDEIIAILQTGVMQRMRQGGHIWAVHEGLLPMQGFDRNTPILVGLGSPITNPYTGVTSPAFPDAGFLCLRYRFWLHAAEQLGIQLAPFFVSEFYPSVHRPLSDLSVEDVAARYAVYEAEIAKDPLCLGVTPFTLGNGWGHENHEPFYPALVAYARSVKDRQNGVSAPPPPPDDGATHVVNVPGPNGQPLQPGTPALNVRSHPWGSFTPPLVRILVQGERVRVDGTYRVPVTGSVWASLTPDCNEWVNSKFLKAL